MRDSPRVSVRHGTEKESKTITAVINCKEPNICVVRLETVVVCQKRDTQIQRRGEEYSYGRYNLVSGGIRPYWSKIKLM